ncbi:MAG: AMP-binding protein, partial [Ruminococcus sp.]|nr:AMP-binding protein [Ruminococcus sp.]
GNPENLSKPESVGLLYPNQQVKVVDGELRLKGANMMLGYVGEEEDGVYDEEGYFCTGDLVRFDDDGFLYITGRIKEIIVLPTGENISPAELEVKFLELNLIQDAQVYEDISDDGSHFLALEVVPRAPEIAKLGEVDPVQTITDELEKINATLPTYQRVSRIIVRDSDFERTPSMKIKRYHKC